MEKVLGLIFLVGLLTSSAWADEVDQRKQELAKLKNQTQKKEEELKKYREQEKKISKEITALEQKKSQTQRLKNKVEKDLSEVEHNLLSVEEKQQALARSRPVWQGSVWQEAARYITQPSCPVCPEEEPLEVVLFSQRMLGHQAAFAAALEQEDQITRQQFATYKEQNKSLQAQSSKIKQEENVLSQSFQKKKQDLDQAKRKADAVRQEIKELNRSAEELNQLLANFERKRNQSAPASSSGNKGKAPSPTIAVPRHSLPWPVTGKVISSFGKEYRADLNTWIFRDGIKIAATYGEAVKASASGSVIYAGPFRSYGNVVIMDHGKGFFTIYGFLKEIEVAVGDKVLLQGTVGTAGKDTQSSSGTGKSAVYFEIRQGTTAVDPVEWLK